MWAVSLRLVMVALLLKARNTIHQLLMLSPLCTCFVSSAVDCLLLSPSMDCQVALNDSDLSLLLVEC